ncbi:MAG: transposase, partial [Candidatus Sumerlaeota bacterium]
MVNQHAFHELFYHINWHSQDDRALIVPEIEIELLDQMKSFCRKYPGAFFFAAGGTKTHIHMAVQLEPKIAPAEFIGKIKGA